MIPAEIENPWPSGLPMAMTQSPTRLTSLSPHGTKGRGSSLSTFKRAKSVLGSVPTTSAGSSSPEKNSIRISSASAITWLFVTMKPSSEITKPEPRAWLRRGRCCPSLRSRKSRNKSSKGEPSGTVGAGPERAATVVEVVMFTTDGLTCSARSANVAGRA